MGLDLAIAIAGGVCSGKSEVAMRLALAVRAKRVAFGDYVRSVCSSRGLRDDRRTLQDLGSSLLLEFGADRFVRGVLDWSACWNMDTVVFDGLRSKEVLEALRRVARDVFVVALLASKECRRNRFSARRRDGDPSEGFEESDAHPIERDLSVLMEEADLLVDGTLSPDEVTRRILRALHSKKLKGE